jgi:hypothetical protein
MKRLLIVIMLVSSIASAVAVMRHQTLDLKGTGVAGVECMGEGCHEAGHEMPVSDCADRCLAAGSVAFDDGVATAATTAVVALAALAFFTDVRRGISARKNFHDDGSRGSLMLERLATDIMRN